MGAPGALSLIGHPFLSCVVLSDTRLHLGVAIMQDHTIDDAERSDAAGGC